MGPGLGLMTHSLTMRRHQRLVRHEQRLMRREQRLVRREQRLVRREQRNSRRIFARVQPISPCRPLEPSVSVAYSPIAYEGYGTEYLDLGQFHEMAAK